MPVPRLALRLLCLFAALLLYFPVSAQAKANDQLPAIVINLPSRTLEFYEGANLVKEYPIAVGKPATPSPLGEYRIENKEVNPAWYPPRSQIVVPSGPDNPLGYRWMGFLPTYGIHGTNAPWSIGSAVSNGCIRMQEKDVEELFEWVPYGTPVKLTYERVRVIVNDKGEASIGLYPDIYGWQDVSVASVKRKLADAGLGGMASDEFLRKLLADEPDRQRIFARFVKVTVNDKPLTEQAVLQQDQLYVPVWPVAGALKANLVWDEERGTIRSEKKAVPGHIKGSRLYVTAEHAQLLFGGQKEWKPDENLLEINLLSVFMNNKALTQDVQVVDGILAVPLLPLAEAVGQKVEWDPVKQVATSYSTALPVSLVDGQPYIKLTKIYDSFKAYVYWNEKGRTIDLTYPFKMEGGSD